MKSETTKYDSSGWRTRAYYRDNGKEIIIQRISRRHPENNHEVYLNENSIEKVKDVIRLAERKRQEKKR